MKPKLLLVILPLLFACKTKKNSHCDCYVEYIQKDTIVLTTEHINFNGKCSIDTTMVNCVIDTLRIPKQNKHE
jgi:hypothetical protein